MIKYLGSKRKLIPQILDVIGPAEGRTALDVFSGTARVGFAFKQAGFAVTSNDHNAYAHIIAKTYIEADEDLNDAAQVLIDEYNEAKAEPGFFTKTYCEDSRFVHPKNGAKVDAIRALIRRKALPELLEAISLTSLIEAADRVDSTCGVQMAYLKSWAKRAHNALSLRVPTLLPQASAGAGKAVRMEALDFVKSHSADVAYLDPPYNQHSYLGNYHVWETLAQQDEPDVYGIAHKRTDVKERKSDFNRKRSFRQALEDLIAHVQAKTIVVSFSNEGFLRPDELVDILKTRGTVEVHAVDYQRYVGAKIGVHNLKGEKVGKVSHLSNKEYTFVVSTTA